MPVGLVTRPTFFPFNWAKPLLSRTSIPVLTTVGLLLKQQEILKVRTMMIVKIFLITILFSPIFGVNFSIYKKCHGKCGNAANDYHPEEIRVSNCFLNISCKHTRNHHAQCHKCSTYSVVGCFKFPFGEINHVKHICSETKSVTELFYRYRNTDDYKISRLCHSEIDKCQARECHTGSHPPQRSFQPCS